MDFAALPPEINSTRMYSGPGSGPMRAAAAAWGGLAAELHSASTTYKSVISQLTGQSWLGPSSQAMVAAISPYVLWLSTAAAQAEQTAIQAQAAAAAYDTAFAMTVPPSIVVANRVQLATLVATNFLGQNTAAIAATEAYYAEMWAQDTAAMCGYAAASMPAAQLTPFTMPPQTTDPAGSARQAAAVGHDTVSSAGAGVQQALSQLGSGTASPSLQAAPMAATPLPAQEIFPDILGLNALAIAGLAISDAGLALSAGAWASADESTRQILKEQTQLEGVTYDILHAIDLFSPLTPSRPEGYIPHITSPVSAAVGEAVSVGRLAVPMSWAANAPEIRSLSYTAPLPGPGAGAPVAAGVGAAPAVSIGSAGTAFSQMALAGMGGSALAGSVNRGRQDSAVTAPPALPAPAGTEPSPDNPVIGIAAEIREFGELRDRGLITQEEYNEQKQRLLGR